MTDLLTRLEAASEGSRELDRDIAREFGWRSQGADIWRPPANGMEGFDRKLPLFSTSLDAALQLVPEGCTPATLKWYPDHVWAHVVRLEDEVMLADGVAATPALALVIACLRTRSDANGSVSV